jgi:hypothetical protein
VQLFRTSGPAYSILVRSYGFEQHRSNEFSCGGGDDSAEYGAARYRSYFVVGFKKRDESRTGYGVQGVLWDSVRG